MQNCLRMSSSSTSGINNSSRGITDSCYFNSPAMIVSINTQKKVTVELLFLFVTEPAPLLESKCTFIFWEVILKSVPWSCISWCWVFWSKLNQTVIKSKLDNILVCPINPHNWCHCNPRCTERPVFWVCNCTNTFSSIVNPWLTKKGILHVIV